MAKPKYPLQAVQDMRERAKKDAIELVAQRRMQLAAAEEELERRIRMVAESRERQQIEKEKMMMQFQGGFQASEMVTHKSFLGRLQDEEEKLQEEVVNQEMIVDNAREELERALEILGEASKEYKVIETHRENWETAIRKELEKKEQKLNDEIGSIIYQRRLKK